MNIKKLIVLYALIAIAIGVLLITPSCVPTKPAPTSSISDVRSRLLAKQVGILSENENVFHMASESMRPTLDTNSYIVVEKITALKDLKVGDIVVFKDNKLGNDVVHRVVGVGEYITTRGDNNNQNDEQKTKLVDIKGRVFCIIYGAK